MKDSSKWKLKLLVFEALCDVSWTSDIDLSASRVSHQLLCYISRKLDPFSRDRDAFQMPWKHQEGRTFPPFSLIGRVKWKVQMDQTQILLRTTSWQSQSLHLYSRLLHISIKNLILMPKVGFLMDTKMERHLLMEKGKSRLLAWEISWKS